MLEYECIWRGTSRRQQGEMEALGMGVGGFGSSSGSRGKALGSLPMQILTLSKIVGNLEGTGFYGWSVSLYEYKTYYYVFHEAGVTEYDTYREAKKQIRWA